MNETDDLDAFISAGTRLIGIDIRPEWREAIRLHLAVSLAHARTVGEFSLPDEADPAPVFKA
jgi:1-carboxybiuret hydrolase subunit AtzG-like protein